MFLSNQNTEPRYKCHVIAACGMLQKQSYWITAEQVTEYIANIYRIPITTSEVLNVLRYIYKNKGKKINCTGTPVELEFKKDGKKTRFHIRI